MKNKIIRTILLIIVIIMNIHNVYAVTTTGPSSDKTGATGTTTTTSTSGTTGVTGTTSTTGTTGGSGSDTTHTTVVSTDPSQIYNLNSNNRILNAGSKVTAYIIYAGIIISVVVLMQKGMKFITASPEGKAEVKKEIIPWVIGLVLLLSINIVIQFVADFSQEHVNTLTI